LFRKSEALPQRLTPPFIQMIYGAARSRVLSKQKQEQNLSFFNSL